MSTNTDGTAATTTPEGTGTAGSPAETGSQEQDPVALARKRQAGAEAARQKAEEQNAALMKELEGYRSKERSAEDQNLADNAKLQERLEFEQRRADEAEARANARILDTLYPNARKELPEVTDEVRLAKFEALLAEDPTAEEKKPAQPQNPNESNRQAGAAPATQPKTETSEDIKARLKTMRPDWL